jgi:1-acyl-sn-glycerol-3-phosphate acyltransferase
MEQTQPGSLTLSGKARPCPDVRVTFWTVLKQALFTVFGLFIRIRVAGNVSLPLKPGFIVAINHLNGTDGFVVQIGLGTRLWFLTAHKWFVSRFNRFFMTNVLDAVPVETGNPLGSLPGLRRSLALLEGGGSIGVFPEGEFNRSGNVGVIQAGTAYLAVRSGKPILPVIIRNLRLGVKVDESTRSTECWTGGLSLAENLLNFDIELAVGDEIRPDPEAGSNPEQLRQEVLRINSEMRRQFDRLAEPVM